MDAYRINIEDLHIALLTKDDKTQASHDAPVLVAGVMQIQLTPQVVTGDLRGDGKTRHTMSVNTGYEVKLEHNKLPPPLLAKLRGMEYVNGIRRGNTRDEPPYFAMGWRVDLTEGHYEMTWLPKCKLSPSDKDMQQQGTNVNYSTDSFKVNAIPLEYNNDYEYVADTSDEESRFTKEMAEKWFDEVRVMAPKGPEGAVTQATG